MALNLQSRVQSNLDSSSIKVIHNDSTALVELFEKDGQLYVRKTVRPRYSLDISAEWLCAREVRALEKVGGLKGLQQLVEQDSPVSFISKYVEGVPLSDAEVVPQDYFDKLKEVLADMHRSGVADLDFAHSKDLIIDSYGNPVVIDLGAAITYEPGHGLKSMIIKPFFDYICKSNYKYLLKRKMKYLPAETTPQEIAEANNIGTLGNLWRVYQATRRYLKYRLIGLQKSN